MTLSSRLRGAFEQRPTTFTTVFDGLVPAPLTANGYVLSDGGVWLAPSAFGAAGGLLSTGRDGALVFDGVTTILGFAPVAGVYTITRDIHATNISCTGIGVLRSGGGRIFATGTATNVVYTASGFNAAAGVGGAAGAAAGVLGAGCAGGNASSGGGISHTVGIPTLIGTSAAANGGAAGGVGGNGGNAASPASGMRGGGGGGDGNSVNAGGTGGAITITAHTDGGATIDALVAGHREKSLTSWQFGTGGGASGNAGGGGGGAAVILCARRIVGGTFSAAGGNGAAGTGTSGGGGGGGGGLVLLVAGTITGHTTNVAGGVGGNGATGGANTGGRGADGGAGVAIVCALVE